MWAQGNWKEKEKREIFSCFHYCWLLGLLLQPSVTLWWVCSIPWLQPALPGVLRWGSLGHPWNCCHPALLKSPRSLPAEHSEKSTVQLQQKKGPDPLWGYIKPSVLTSSKTHFINRGFRKADSAPPGTRPVRALLNLQGSKAPPRPGRAAQRQITLLLHSHSRARLQHMFFAFLAEVTVVFPFLSFSTPPSHSPSL